MGGAWVEVSGFYLWHLLTSACRPKNCMFLWIRMDWIA